MINVNDVLKYLESRFPYDLAADFDKGKIGLTIGNKNNIVTGIVCSLDLTNEVIEDAIEKNANLIICHHPFAFSGMTKVLYEEEKGSLIYNMVKNDISLIAMHTNMDLGYDGVADTLCKLYDLKNSNYGVNFKDDYARYGEIEEVTLKQLAEMTKKIFNLNSVKVVGDLNKKITKIGILGGSGGQEYEIIKAINMGCDCYITGEIKHNIALTANYYGLSLIEISHGIEKIVFNKLIDDIKKEFNINIEYTSYDTDLFKYI